MIAKNLNVSNWFACKNFKMFDFSLNKIILGVWYLWMGMQENFKKTIIPLTSKMLDSYDCNKISMFNGFIARSSKCLIDLIVRFFGFVCLIWLQDFIIDDWITMVTTK